ncbi:CHAT domain-containing protein [Dapis sp. BLCC M229]|uniref:CHAT domain-containing protein n=1 Tax=Dapis sp. BLCC M229 TaxID=3400188 RepID=UPI003CE7531B
MTQADLLRLYQGQFKLIKILNYCSWQKLFLPLVLLNCILASIWSLPTANISFITQINESLSQFLPVAKSLDTNLEISVSSSSEYREKSKEEEEVLQIKNYQNNIVNQLPLEINFQSSIKQEITFFNTFIPRQKFLYPFWNQNIYRFTQQTNLTTDMPSFITYTDFLKANNLSNSNTANFIPNLSSDTTSEAVVTMLEKNRIQEYSDYLGEDFKEQLVNPENIQNILVDIQRQTGKKSAVIYINVYQDQLQIILLTQKGKPILKTVPGVNREQLRNTAIIFSGEITDFRNSNTTSYLPLAQKLYNWLIAPIATELEKANIDTLLFSIDSGFRFLPLAALHDGEKFLIEKYNFSLIPSFSLINHNYNSLENTQVLAMGASKFSDQPPLPAVSVELTTITEKLWEGNSFLNQEFTRQNLIYQHQNYPYSIIHLATHAEFISGDVSKSYIQLWDDKLQLNQIGELGWNNPEIELLVLSACRTAVGDKNYELGFAGLAIATGVKSAVGSLWFVNDEATLGLMTEFYSHLGNVNIKAEALREAQVAMLKGKVVIEKGILRGSVSDGEMSLPPELANIQNQKFSHPYYWAGFTMVGSPW